jgi:hypothetical protein
LRDSRLIAIERTVYEIHVTHLLAPRSTKGETLRLSKAIFDRWLGDECGLLESYPFAMINRRSATGRRTDRLGQWIVLNVHLPDKRSNIRRLPAVDLEVTALVGGRHRDRQYGRGRH